MTYEKPGYGISAINGFRGPNNQMKSQSFSSFLGLPSSVLT